MGRALADGVVAHLSLPVFDNSAMDGPMRCTPKTPRCTTLEHPVPLPVAEDFSSGRTDQLTLQPGTAHWITTGAPIPSGGNGHVPVENIDGGRQSVLIQPDRPDRQVY
ncbi:hypothetical protein [Mycobacterium lepromatosis]|uniref:hypothetical protein n=1 Tax=Mycobacterium lepromatosis TaxID=480418 RepID=UPI000AEC601D|nr:hypothetical protein [Mycobacterium lepromatosis]